MPADQIRSSRTIGIAFGLLILAFGSLYIISPNAGSLWTQVILAGLAVFALRGVYFAMLEEISIPYSLTGTVVGIVSFIGFIPDMFPHLLSGWFVDTFEGIRDYHYYFGFLAVAVVGMTATGKVKRSIGHSW